MTLTTDHRPVQPSVLHRSALHHGNRTPAAPAVLTVAAVAASATAGVGAALARVAGEAWVALSGPATVAPDELLTGLVAGLGSVLCVWLGLGFVISLGSALPGRAGCRARSASARLAPVAVRRLAAAVLGGALLASGAAPALAAPLSGPARGLTTVSAWGGGAAAWAGGGTDPSPATPARAPGPTDGVAPGTGLSPDLVPGAPPSATASPSDPPTDGWPARPAPTAGTSGADHPSVSGPGATRSASAPVASPGLGVLGPCTPRATSAVAAGVTTALAPVSTPASGQATVTVTAGDTLWGIAAARLGPHAGTVDISREWPRWFAANRGVVGPDPDRIQPGQVLEAPPAPDGE